LRFIARSDSFTRDDKAAIKHFLLYGRSLLSMTRKLFPTVNIAGGPEEFVAIASLTACVNRAEYDHE